MACDRKTNEQLRGVSWMESLEIILSKSPTVYSEAPKWELATRKNDYDQQLITQLTPASL